MSIGSHPFNSTFDKLNIQPMKNFVQIKRIKRIALIFVCGMVLCDCYSQVAPAIAWQNTIGGTLFDVLTSIQQTADDGYILGGYSTSDSSGDKTENSNGSIDYWIVKTDSAGNIQWQNTIGGSNDDYLYSIEQTNDGGYILGGVSNSNISGDKTENCMGTGDYWIVKTDASGNIQWENTIGGDDADLLQSVRQTNDGGYILAGSSISGISGDKTENPVGLMDYWIVKTDASGNIQWQNTLGGSSTDYSWFIEQTSDGGYIVGGYSNSNTSGDKTENCIGAFDYWIVKTDSIGNIQWQNTIGGSDNDMLRCIHQTADGGYIFGGTSASNISGDKTENNNGMSDYWIVKTDGSGNIQWENTIGGTDEDNFFIVQQTSDGGYIIGGYSRSDISGDKTEQSLGNEDYWIVKTNNTGNIQWQNTIGGNSPDYIYAMQQTSDGGYILAGPSSSIISGDKTENCIGSADYWIVKLLPDTITSVSNLQSSPFNLQLFPNPCASGGTIRLTLPVRQAGISTKHNAPLECEIISMIGQKVFTSSAPLAPKGESAHTEIDVSFLAKGIYVVRVGDGERFENRKLVIE